MHDRSNPSASASACAPADERRRLHQPDAATASLVVNRTPDSRHWPRHASRSLLVEPAGGILDERDPPTTAEQAHDRCVVAHVGGDAEEDHLGGVERIEHRVGVRVGEDVEALLQQEQLAAARDEAPDERRRIGDVRERERVDLLRLGDSPGARRPSQAVRRKRARGVGLVRDLGVGQLVVVGGGDVRDAARPRPADEPGHRRHDCLGSRHGELPVGIDEVDLRVDVPEDRATRHARAAGSGRSRRPTFDARPPSVTTMSAVKSFSPRISDEPTP